ncbi:hypothetical protein [Specibacter sp. RAF43]|uniref:hypothetical protein n=1 Tax=Specibacter sp. RAF43 TaxID=3233057 RepID=UPI003F95BCEE
MKTEHTTASEHSAAAPTAPPSDTTPPTSAEQPIDTAFPTDTERALATLWLYIGRFQILKLSAEEREALGDAVDRVHQHDDPEEFTPLQRWWHEDAPLHWDPKYA